MTITCSQFYHLSPSDVELFAVDYTDTLSTTETLSSPTVTVVAGSSLLTVANVQVNATAISVLGRSVSASKAVLFKISGQALTSSTAYTPAIYRARVQVTTSSNPARTLVRDVTFDCV